MIVAQTCLKTFVVEFAAGKEHCIKVVEENKVGVVKTRQF
jgi:hypothetical protein